ncbi:MAG: TssQ family T6SS-associated lipoprotein [Lautropia sp.]
MLAALVLVSGCATLGIPTTTADEPSSTQADTAGAQRDLAAGIDLYDKGDYVAAIRTLLTSREIWQAPMPTRVAAHKYVAFSHCLSNRPRPCKQSFSDLLQLQPDFELAAAESGHPLWRDAFRQAKREAGGSDGSARQALAQRDR